MTSRGPFRPETFYDSTKGQRFNTPIFITRLIMSIPVLINYSSSESPLLGEMVLR